MPNRTVLVCKRPVAAHRFDVLLVVLARQSRQGILSFQLERNLERRGLDRIHRVAIEETGGQAAFVDATQAAVWIARALLIERLTSPSAQRLPEDVLAWLGPWHRIMSSIGDLYTCATCTHGLPGGWQLALSRGRLRNPGAIRCRRCGGNPKRYDLAAVPEVPRHAAAARLLVEAGEPRRALALAALAVSQGVPPVLISGLRGEAYLAMSNPVQAAVELERAVELEPDNLRLRALKVEADARCGLVAWAMAGLDAIAARQPGAEYAVGAVRSALHSREDTPAADLDRALLDRRCLEALALTDLGRFDEARNFVEGGPDAHSHHPVLEHVARAIALHESDPENVALLDDLAALAKPDLETALALLNRILQR